MNCRKYEGHAAHARGFFNPHPPDWYRHSWSTQDGTIINTTLLCPLVERCGCPCEAKIVEMPGHFTLRIHAKHTAADHATDNAKFLTHDNAVKTAPMNTASELMKNVHDSPTKKIDPTPKDSVARLTRQERVELLTAVCYGAELNSDIGSLKTLMDKFSGIHARPVHWCATTHRLLQNLHWQGLGRFRAMCNDRLLQHRQPTQHDLIHRQPGSGYSVMLHGDVTSKTSSSAFNRLSFGVNMLDGHCMP